MGRGNGEHGVIRKSGPFTKQLEISGFYRAGLENRTDYVPGDGAGHGSSPRVFYLLKVILNYCLYPFQRNLLMLDARYSIEEAE